MRSDPTREILYLVPGRPRPARPRLLPEGRRRSCSEYRDQVPGVPRPRCSTLAGEPIADAAGQRHLRARDAAGPRALDQRREPRCGEDLQQGRARRPAEAVPRASTGPPGPPSWASRRRPAVVVAPAELLQGVRRDRQRAAGRTVEAVSASATLVNGFAPYLQQGVRRRRVRLLRHDAARRAGACSRAGSAASTPSNGNARRDARQALRRASTSRPRPRRAWSSWSRTCARAYRDGIDGLEWMGPETKKQAQEKLAKFRPKIGYPNKWRDYSKLEIKHDDLVGNVMRAFDRRERVSARQGRQAGRSRGVGHDAADGERLLQPGAQRDRVPRRDPAAAVLRPGGRRRRRTTAPSAP